MTISAVCANETHLPRYRYTGKERDTESGNDYFFARYYSSAMGRFMSPDSGAFHWENPQSLDRYTYTLNNPLGLVDPDGKDPIDAQLLWKVLNFKAWALPVAREEATNTWTKGCGICNDRTGEDVQRGGIDSYLDLINQNLAALSDQVEGQVLAWANLDSTTADQVFAARGRITGNQEDQDATAEKVKNAADKGGGIADLIPHPIAKGVGWAAKAIVLAVNGEEDTYQKYLAQVLGSQLNTIAKKKDEEEKKKMCQQSPGSAGCGSK